MAAAQLGENHEATQQQRQRRRINLRRLFMNWRRYVDKEGEGKRLSSNGRCRTLTSTPGTGDSVTSKLQLLPSPAAVPFSYCCCFFSESLSLFPSYSAFSSRCCCWLLFLLPLLLTPSSPAATLLPPSAAFLSCCCLSLHLSFSL